MMGIIMKKSFVSVYVAGACGGLVRDSKVLSAAVFQGPLVALICA